MTPFVKRTVALGFAGALALAGALPAKAQTGWEWAAIGAGIAAGATAVGAATSPYPYAYAPGPYAYSPNGVVVRGPRGAYAAEPGFAYGDHGCWTDGGGGRPDWSCGY